MLLAEYFWLIANFGHVQLVKTIYDSNKKYTPASTTEPLFGCVIPFEGVTKVEVLPGGPYNNEPVTSFALWLCVCVCVALGVGVCMEIVEFAAN